MRNAWLSLIWLTPEASPFKDFRVRRATSLAIDGEGIAKTLSFGKYKTWGTFFAPYNPGINYPAA